MNINFKKVPTDSDIKLFINTAVTSLLDKIDHSPAYYQLIKNEEFMKRLIEIGVCDDKLNFNLEMLEILADFKCTNEKCNSISFNYECPIIVCAKCNMEYYIKGGYSKPICKACPSFALGTCNVGKIIMEEKDDGYKSSIVSTKSQAFQGVGQPLEQLATGFPESK